MPSVLDREDAGGRRGGCTRTAAVLSFFSVALLLAATAVAQAPSEEEVFFESVDVKVVNVEVFVTDSRGNPVQGLQKEDFVLTEGGEPVEITNFLAVREGRLAEAGSAGSAPAAPIPNSQRLHVIVFLDHFNMPPRDRNQVLTQLRRFLLDSLSHEDRVMLASFDGTLRVERNFTSVPELLQPLLDQMDKRSSRAFEVEAGIRNILQQIDNVSLAGNSASVDQAEEEAQVILGSIQTFSQELQVRNRFTLEAMGRLVSSLAGLPGRKALVYVSNGMPLQPGQILLEAWHNKFESFARELGVSSVATQGLEYDSSADFQELVSIASANRTVIYTIDTLAQRDFGAVAAESGGFDMSAVSTASGGQAMPTELKQRQGAGFRNAMQMLAVGTGGLTFINSKALGDNLSKLAGDFKTYYSLGYSPRRKSDGKFRPLKVKVQGGDFLVRHRSGFRDKTSDEEMSDQTLSALLLNIAENPLGVTLERAPDRKIKKKRFQVPILVKIPIGKLALLPDQEAHRGKVKVYVAVADAEGGNSKVEERTMPVTIPLDRYKEAQGQFIGHEMTLEMRGGFHRLAVTVRDEIAAVASTVRVNFRVGA